KAGIKCSAIDRAVRSIIKKAGYGKYFIHATGHGIGRNTHELLRISEKSRGVLEAGMVITIEPGIYLKKSWGMRIEDMVLVTRRGCKVLTRVPKKLTIKN
ncbi:M24 family metallopeptidase, partial [Candidatus Margulisiibacteriota bacterium]